MDRAFADSLAATIHANDSYNFADAQRAMERERIFSLIAEVENGTPADEFLGLTVPEEILELATDWATATDGSLDPFSEAGSVRYEAYNSLPSVWSFAVGDQLSPTPRTRRSKPRSCLAKAPTKVSRRSASLSPLSSAVWPRFCTDELRSTSFSLRR